MDFYFSPEGDIKLSPQGDIGLTEEPWRDDAQQAYIRVMTSPGDFLVYRNLGADMSQLYGMPQSKTTGDFGVRIIEEALNREGRFIGKSFSVEAFPTGPQSIRFDIFIISGNRQELILSIDQDLGLN